jgi:hypothetical protein
MNENLPRLWVPPIAPIDADLPARLASEFGGGSLMSPVEYCSKHKWRKENIWIRGMELRETRRRGWRAEPKEHCDNRRDSSTHLRIFIAVSKQALILLLSGHDRVRECKVEWAGQ